MRLAPLNSTSASSCASAPSAQAGEPLGGGVEQARVVVDQRPVLLGPEQRRGGAQVGAGAAAQVDDGDGPPAVEMRGERMRQLAVARAMVDAARAGRAILARSRSWSPAPLMTSAMSARRILPARQLLAGRPGRIGHAARAGRLVEQRGRWRRRARPASPGGTLMAAASGTVSAAAPPVVQTIGRPRAMASASTMP